MSAEIIKKFTGIIVLLVLIVIGLLIYISVLKNEKPKEELEAGWCGVVDPVNKVMKNKANYRYSANFINNDFDAERGRNVFKGNCMQCHSVLKDTKIIGPPLFDVFNHIPATPNDWIFHYLKNSDSLVNSGNEYAKKLREIYPAVKWNHTDSLLSKQDLIDLCGFIGINK